jgi:aldehyde dehydrogenase (NAD+)
MNVTLDARHAAVAINWQAPYTMTIGGKAVTAAQTFEVYNPATNAVIAHAPEATREQLDEAGTSARRT